MKNIIQALKVIALALILSFGISYVYAWTAPTVTPPEGNISAPINTSATAQYKEGALGIGGLIRGYANAIFDGNVGIGTTNPAGMLQIGTLFSGVNGSINGASNPTRLIVNGTNGSEAAITLGYYSAGYGLNVWVPANPSAPWPTYIDNINANSGFRFRNNTSATPVELMTIDAAGSVGIGVPNPTQKLDVAGNIKGTGLCISTDCKTAWPASGGATPPTGSTFLDTSATAQTKDGTLTVGGFKIPGGTSGKVLISDAVGNASWGTNPVSTVGGGMLPRESFYNNVSFNGTGANVFTAPAGVTEVLVEVFGPGGGGGAGYIGGSNGATGGTSSFGPIASPLISATSGSGGTVVVEVWCDGTCATNGTTGASGSGSGGYVNSRLYSLDQFGYGGVGNLMLARGGTGGRGGYSKGVIPVTPGATYTVTVGAGGAGGCYYGWYCGSAGSDGFVRVSYLGDVTLTPIQKCANAGGMALDASGNCTYTYSNLMGTFGWSRELRNGDGQYVCANIGGKPTWSYLSNTTSTHGTSCGGNYGLVYWGGTSFVNWAEFGGICGGNVTVESTVTCKVPI